MKTKINANKYYFNFNTIYNIMIKIFLKFERFVEYYMCINYLQA